MHVPFAGNRNNRFPFDSAFNGIDIHLQLRRKLNDNVNLHALNTYASESKATNANKRNGKYHFDGNEQIATKMC